MIQMLQGELIPKVSWDISAVWAEDRIREQNAWKTAHVWGRVRTATLFFLMKGHSLGLLLPLGLSLPSPRELDKLFSDAVLFIGWL